MTADEMKISVISSETDYFFSRTALMYIYMGHMTYEHTKPYENQFWDKNDIALIRGYVDQVDFDRQELRFDQNQVYTSDHGPTPERLSYDYLILALGSKPNKFDWPGQDLKGVSGLYSKGELDYLENHSSKINGGVIVGGGLIGIELAEMLRSRNKEVTMLVRESSYWNKVLPPEESVMVNDHIIEHGVDLRLKTELSEIIDDGQGSCGSVRTSEDDFIDCQFVGLTVGVRPNVDWLRDGPLNVSRGIVVNAQLQTNVDRVYAVGDCAELTAPNEGRRAIEAVWYTGRMMGETVAYQIAGHDVDYNPGTWFNSAKFFDIEYQVYGHVPVQDSEDIKSLYVGEPTKRRSVRITYRSTDQVVIGFNLMGMRYRQEVCTAWIERQANLSEVLSQLELANFDPEFFQNIEDEVRHEYQRQFGTSIKRQGKRSLSLVRKLLKSR